MDVSLGDPHLAAASDPQRCADCACRTWQRLEGTQSRWVPSMAAMNAGISNLNQPHQVRHVSKYGKHSLSWKNLNKAVITDQKELDLVASRILSILQRQLQALRAGLGKKESPVGLCTTSRKFLFSTVLINLRNHGDPMLTAYCFRMHMI